MTPDGPGDLGYGLSVTYLSFHGSFSTAPQGPWPVETGRCALSRADS